MLVGSLLARPFAGRHNIGHGVGGEVRIMRTTAAVTSKLKIEPPVALETGYFSIHLSRRCFRPPPSCSRAVRRVQYHPSRREAMLRIKSSWS
jgi:hypothetical protein